MSKYEILINENKYEVEITYDDGRRAVLKVNGKEYEVEAKSVSTATAPVETPQISPPPSDGPQTSAPAPVPAAPTGEATKIEGEHAILAPMPGMVLEVIVNTGQNVKHGDVIMRIEAMKMENDIKSDAEGKVKEIRVSKGSEVQQNDVLMVLED